MIVRCGVPAGPTDTLKSNPDKPKETHLMLMTFAIVLIVLWALGLVSSTTMGGFIHILLVVAIIMLLVRVVQGRRI